MADRVPGGRDDAEGREAFEYDVFLSFASADHQAAAAIFQTLRTGGLRVFWAPDALGDSLGRDFIDAIEAGIVGSRHFVLLWTAEAKESQWVRAEQKAFYTQCYLRANGTRRLVILPDGLEPISTLPVLLRNLQVARSAEEVSARLGGGRAVSDARVPAPPQVKVVKGGGRRVHRIQKALDEERFFLVRQEIRPLHGRNGGPEMSEILIRMRDEQGQIALPGSFIPAAERYRLISRIDRWVVKNAFKSLVDMQRSSAKELHWAINLSGRSIGEKSFLADVIEQLDLSGVSPGCILFEVSETAAVANLARAQEFIRTLKARGCRFVLDDFGTGLSSFAYLKNLDVDFLKIDGGFVRDVNESSIQRALVESIHQIGQLLGIATIAESMENDEILATLQEIGVDYVQGYGVARPEPLY